MKRTPHDPTDPKPIKPFFWTDCACCFMQFRRERGYRFFVPMANHSFSEINLCQECAPDLAAAEKFRSEITKPLSLFGRPFPPPPPPQKAV